MQSCACPSHRLLGKSQADPVGRVGMGRVTQSCAGSCQSCRLGLLAYKGMGAERMRESGKGMFKGKMYFWESTNTQTMAGALSLLLTLRHPWGQ